MNLQDFVKNTLIEITEAVAQAQEEAKLHVAPGYVEDEKQIEAQMVSFELAVTTSKEAGGAIKVWSVVDAKGGGKSEAKNTIKFEVPVYFQAPTRNNKRHFSHQESDGSGPVEGNAARIVNTSLPGSGIGGGAPGEERHIVAEKPYD